MRSLRFLFGTIHLVARIQRAGVDAKERQVADERVVQDLERERRERLRRRRALRVSGSPRSLWPLTGGTSTGDGMYSTTASSTACTPLFLNAEPQVTRQISFFERARRAGPA